MRPESLKGHLDALLLSVLEAGPRHGYAVIEAVRTGSGGAFDLQTGTIYPALHRLERAGFIRSHWKVIGGRRRREYELTASGQRGAHPGASRLGAVLRGSVALLKGDSWPAVAN